MKRLTIAVCVILSACHDTPVPSTAEFSYSNGAGIWIIDEIATDDGEIFTENLKSNNIFGAYNGSVQLNEDRTYIPVNFNEIDGSYPLEPEEAGTYEYISATKEITFSSGQFFQAKFHVTYFNGKTLHLRAASATYKFWKKD